MAGHRIDRITEDVRRELSAIFRELKDPRVKDCFLSIVRIDLTNDLSYCTVYVSTIEGLDRTKKAVEGLKSAAGYIRREVGHRLDLRHTPQMIFKATDAIEYGASISKKLKELGASDNVSGEMRDNNEDFDSTESVSETSDKEINNDK